LNCVLEPAIFFRENVYISSKTRSHFANFEGEKKRRKM